MSLLPVTLNKFNPPVRRKKLASSIYMCIGNPAVTRDSHQLSVETEVRAARVAAGQHAIGTKDFRRPADHTAEPHGRGSALPISERVTDLENPVAHFDRSRGADWHVRIRTRLEQPQERDIMSAIRAEQFGRTLTAVVENDRRPVAR